MEHRTISVASRIPLDDIEWAQRTVHRFAEALAFPRNARWRMRFIQQSGKGHLVCCMLRVRSRGFSSFVIGAGEGEHRALSNSLWKLNQDLHMQPNEQWRKGPILYGQVG